MAHVILGKLFNVSGTVFSSVKNGTRNSILLCCHKEYAVKHLVGARHRGELSERVSAFFTFLLQARLFFS